MPWDSVLWVVLTALAPAGAAWVWPRLTSRFGERARRMEPLAAWAHGLAPVYLALVTGAVLGRDAGLYGQGALRWLGGTALCGALLVAVRYGARRLRSDAAPILRHLPPPSEVLKEEPRWALYRAAGALWTGAWIAGVAVGLGLAATEWALGRLARERASADAWRDPMRWIPVARMAFSSLIFLITQNLWLTVLTHAGALAFARGWELPRLPSGDPGPPASGDDPDAARAG